MNLVSSDLSEIDLPSSSSSSSSSSHSSIINVKDNNMMMMTHNNPTNHSISDLSSSELSAPSSSSSSPVNNSNTFVDEGFQQSTNQSKSPTSISSLSSNSSISLSLSPANNSQPHTVDQIQPPRVVRSPLSDHESIDGSVDHSTLLPCTTLVSSHTVSNHIESNDRPDLPSSTANAPLNQYPTITSIQNQSQYLDSGIKSASPINRLSSRSFSNIHSSNASSTFSLPNQIDARKDTSGRTRLFKSVRSRDPDRVRSLLDAGANVNHKDHAGWTPLHEAMVTPDNTDVLRLLLERGANPNAQGLHGNTPLHDADTFEYFPSASLLLKYGASVSVRNEDGDSPLNNANTDPEIKSLFLHYAAIEDALLRRDAFGMTLLHRACWESVLNSEQSSGSSHKSDLIEELVAYRRVDVNVADNAGWTPLHELVAQQRINLVQLLLRHGADVNARGYRGTTPLHIATRLGDHVLVDILLDHGADPYATLASADGDAPPEPNSSPIDQCVDINVAMKLKTHPFEPTRAEEMRRYMLDEIAKKSGTAATDWTGPQTANEGAIFSDGGGAGQGADDTKSERSRDEGGSGSAVMRGTSVSGGSLCGAGVSRDRKLTREDRLMASYIARIEKQEKAKTNKSASSSSNPSPTQPSHKRPLQRRRKSPTQDTQYRSPTSVKTEPCMSSYTHPSHMFEIGRNRKPYSSGNNSAVDHSDQLVPNDAPVNTNDLVHYCLTGDAGRVKEALTLSGVAPKLPKSILAATRAGHLEIVQVLVDRLFVVKANKYRMQQTSDNSGSKKAALAMSVQHILTAALHQAVKSEHTNIAEYLLSKGGRSFVRNRSGLTPIEQARALDNAELIALLERFDRNAETAVSLSSSKLAADGGPNKNVTVIVGRNSVEVTGKRRKGSVSHDLPDEDLSDTDLDSDSAFIPAAKKARHTNLPAHEQPYQTPHIPPTSYSFKPAMAISNHVPFLSKLGLHDPNTQLSEFGSQVCLAQMESSPGADPDGFPTVISVQHGSRFVVLEGDVRAHVPADAFPLKGVFREATDSELAALVDSPVGLTIQKTTIAQKVPRVALLDELVAAMHACSAAPLLVRFAGWRRVVFGKNEYAYSATSNGRSANGASSGYHKSNGTKASGTSKVVVAPRPAASARVVPPKIMCKHHRGVRQTAK